MAAVLTPSERALNQLPPHLRRYVVAQDYGAYTPRDQAVWRHILRRLVRMLRGRWPGVSMSREMTSRTRRAVKP